MYKSEKKMFHPLTYPPPQKLCLERLVLHLIKLVDS